MSNEMPMVRIALSEADHGKRKTLMQEVRTLLQDRHAVQGSSRSWTKLTLHERPTDLGRDQFTTGDTKNTKLLGDLRVPGGEDWVRSYAAIYMPSIARPGRQKAGAAMAPTEPAPSRRPRLRGAAGAKARSPANVMRATNSPRI